MYELFFSSEGTEVYTEACNNEVLRRIFLFKKEQARGQLEN
jgi:hypothetical protein